MLRTVTGRAALGAAALAMCATPLLGQTDPTPPKPQATASGLTWEVAYLIDTSQTIESHSQFEWPRSNRGIGLSPDGRYLYLGYNEPNGNPAPGLDDHQVRRVDTQNADLTDATLAVLLRHRGKSITVDDRGRVYLAEGSDADVHLGFGGIHIYDPDLNVELAVMPPGSAYGLAKPEGVTTQRENGVLALYVTDRSNKRLHRFEIVEPPTGVAIGGIVKAGLAGGIGEAAIPGAVDLRGVKIDRTGRIWIADLGGGRVFRCEADGTGCIFAAVPKAMDIGLMGAKAYITQSTAPVSPTMVVLQQADLSVDNPILAPPWAALALDPLGQRMTTPAKTPLGNLAGAVSGPRTATGDKVLFVTNERGQTEHEKSVYGRCDAASDNPGGNCTFTDITKDDNEPVFRFVEPNFTPVAACRPVLVEADAACRATASINDGSFDPDFDFVTLTQSSTVFPLGTSAVTLTAADPFGAAGSCSAQVTVRDVTPPTLLGCPAPVIVSSAGACSATVNPGSPSGADNCSVSVTGVRSDGLPLFAPFAVGTTTITWSATDGVSTIACPAPQPIIVNATPPILTVTSPAAGSQVPVGSTITLSATYTGEVTSATWTVGTQTIAGVVNTATSTITAPVTLSVTGTVAVALSASNGCGSTGSAGTTVTVFQPCSGRIGDFVWNDLNANGIQNAGEPGLANVPVQLKDANGNILQTATTNGSGYYEFIGLCAGTYRVVVGAVAGFTATLSQAAGSTAANDSNASPSTVTLGTNSATDVSIDFGLVKFATGYRTQTQGGWGTDPSGNNPGMLLQNNFAAVYPGGSVSIGGSKSLKFTKASAIAAFLPQGSTAGVLKASATNPLGSAAGVFAGQVLALRLSVDFSAAGIIKPGLGSLTVITGPLAGYTVTQVLLLANTVLGGTTGALPAGMTISTLNEVVDLINNNFTDGTENHAYLR